MHKDPYQKTSQLIFPTLDIRNTLHTTLIQAHDADQATVYADVTFITNESVLQLLANIAQKENNKVSVHIHGARIENQKTIDFLHACPQISLKTGNQHGKRLLVAFKNNDETDWHHIVFEGSYNPNNTQHGRRKNTEIALVTTDDTSYYQKHKESHESGVSDDGDGAHILPHSPRTREVYDTTLYRLNESLAARIHPEQGGTLYLGTMGYSQRDLHKKLLLFCMQGGTVHMIVDWESITKDSEQLLKELCQACANIVVAKTNNDKKMHGNFHRKYFVRVPDNKTADLVVIQSENFTNRTQPVFNHASYHPNDAQLGAQLIAAHQEQVLKGLPFAQLQKIKTPKAKKMQKEAAITKNCMQSGHASVDQ